MLPVLEKDIRLFIRDKRNLILVILTPIIIMFILGNVFKGTEKEDYLKNIEILVCNSDANFILPDYFNAKTTENCEQNAQTLVSRGKFKGAIIVPENFSKDILNGYGTTITIYLDNSEPQTAFALSTAIEAHINKLNENISTTFIREAWLNLRELNTKIKFVAKNLESTKSSAKLIQKKTENISDIIEKINLTKAYYYLDEVNHTLNEIKSNLTIKTNISEGNSTNLTDLNTFDEILANITASIDAIAENCTFTQNFCEQFNKSINSIKQSNQKIFEQKNQIAENIKLLGNISVEPLYTQVDSITEIKISIHSQLKELENLVINFTGQIVVLQEDLNKTAILLDEYTSRKPENIVRAVTVKNNDSFHGKNNLFFRSTGILMIVLLFITLLVSSSNIVSEKTSSTFLRNIMSPMPMWSFILQKLAFLCALCFIQIFLMLGVLSYFKVYIPLNIELIFIILITSINFVSIGLFIGAISKSENISLLSALVLAIPMIFLSGVFFPFENMPNFIGTIGKWLPMSLAIAEMENIIIYSVGFGFKIIVLIALSIALFIVSSFILKKNADKD